MKCEHLHDSGAYVLGALSPHERERYERHLAGCAVCRAEVADLAALPGLLGRLDLPTAQAVAAGGADAMHAVLETMPGVDASAPWAGPTAWAGPTVTPTDPEPKRDPLVPKVLDRINAQHRAERRKRRLQFVATALAAACLGVSAVLGVRAVNFGAGPDLVAMTPVVPESPVTASVALESYSGGTRVHMRCRYRAGTGEGEWMFHLVVVPKAGKQEDISSWSAGFGDEYDVLDHSNLGRADIARVEIRNNEGKPLLVYTVT